jgi:membrane-associated phospholipid phosphatase
MEGCMNAWRLYILGAVMLIATGTALTWMGDKAHFLKWLTTHRNPVFDQYFYHVTKLGEPPGFIIIGLILWLRSWRRMVIIPVLGGLVTAVSYLMKKFFDEERPVLYLKRTGWEGPMAVMDYHLVSGHTSFPSGHSMAAWALFTFTAAMIRKGWVSVFCLILAASVSISRVYLMVHFLRDVVAGAVIGFALGYAFYFLYEAWNKNNQSITSFEADKS